MEYFVGFGQSALDKIVRTSSRRGVSRAHMRRDANVDLFGYRRNLNDDSAKFCPCSGHVPSFVKTGRRRRRVVCQTAERRRSQMLLHEVVVVVVVPWYMRALPCCCCCCDCCSNRAQQKKNIYIYILWTLSLAAPSPACCCRCCSCCLRAVGSAGWTKPVLKTNIFVGRMSRRRFWAVRFVQFVHSFGGSLALTLSVVELTRFVRSSFVLLFARCSSALSSFAVAATALSLFSLAAWLTSLKPESSRHARYSVWRTGITTTRRAVRFFYLSTAKCINNEIICSFPRYVSVCLCVLSNAQVK